MFYVIGGANIDLHCKVETGLIMRDSNPGHISFSMGGVARNVAVNLAHLKEEVSFLTAFGIDGFADELINDLRRRDIDLSFSLRSDKYPTSMFVAILDKEDMSVGVNDLSVIQEINKEAIDSLSSVVTDEDYVFLDTNHSEEMIDYILNNVKGYKVCDAISANKVIKLKNLTGKLDILKMNLLEAEKLNGSTLFNDNLIVSFISKLIESGTKEVLISGKNYVYVGTKDEIAKYSHDAYNDTPVNTLGAGDALISYYAYGRKKGDSVEKAISLALAASVLSTYVEEATVPNEIEEIIDKANKIRIEKETY